MKPYALNAVNALILISLGLWGYLSSGTPSLTALIPVIFGIILLALTNGLKKEQKIPAHIVVVFTILVIIGLLKPLTASLSRTDYWATFRVSIMLLSSIIALISFIKSFKEARKNK